MRRGKRPDWSIKLTRSLTLEDGTKLVTLADARGAMLIRFFERVNGSADVGLTIERLLTAAETGSLADREAATDQVDFVLRRPAGTPLIAPPQDHAVGTARPVAVQ
jgi:hypothetical protein